MAWNLDEALAYYKRLGAPGDQSAVISLLREVQSEHGGSIPQRLLPEISAGLVVKETFLAAIVRRVPSLRLGSTHTLELCAGPNCGKAAVLAAFAEKSCTGKPVQLKFVGCMRQCAKGPNLRWDGQLHNRADEALIRRLLEQG